VSLTKMDPRTPIPQEVRETLYSGNLCIGHEMLPATTKEGQQSSDLADLRVVHALQCSAPCLESHGSAYDPPDSGMRSDLPVVVTSRAMSAGDKRLELGLWGISKSASLIPIALSTLLDGGSRIGRLGV
jgi:hypothetical protein